MSPFIRWLHLFVVQLDRVLKLKFLFENPESIWGIIQLNLLLGLASLNIFLA